ncbi:gamma-glutamylcyclotransferase family protein [Flavihumibacter petaseus]|nr:gamma-glutamylcyclotransferase family protein [Flavihumibacter petaseus]
MAKTKSFDMLPDYQLFVYGSLRKGFNHAAYDYIRRYFTLVGEATVPGGLYDMGEYPAAIPEESGARIVGELYRIREIDEMDWAIAQLDDYEGVTPDDDEPPMYRRDRTAVTLSETGETTSAWIYWFSGDITGKPRIISGDVLQYRSGKS